MDLIWFGPNLAYVHGVRTWESFIKRLGIKRSNIHLDATRVFTFHLSLALNDKSITFSLCTFNLLMFFLASSGLLYLRFCNPLIPNVCITASYLLWSLTSFCRCFCTYLMLELLYIWRLIPVLRLSIRTWAVSYTHLTLPTIYSV